MTNTPKITKKDNYDTLRKLVTDCVDNQEDQDRLLAFIDHEVELMDQRAAKSKRYQQEHKATGDIMTTSIMEALHTAANPMSVADLVNSIVDATPQKIVYRVGVLFKNGSITKETQTVKDEAGVNRRVTYYKAII